MAATFEHTAPMACPACISGAGIAEIPAAAKGTSDLWVSLPDIHCAACIVSVEKALMAHSNVEQARVNLSLRRVGVRIQGTVEATELVSWLRNKGHAAQELDGALLEAGHRDEKGAALLMRLGVSGFAMMNVMLLSVAVWSGATDTTRDLMHWISAAIAFPTVAYCGMPFFTSALKALKAGRLNMDVPITLALILALGTSLVETMLSGAHAYFDAAVALAFFLLTGRYLDHKVRASARSAAQELAALEVPRALRVEEGQEVQVSARSLEIGDIIRVLPGAGVPVDGRVIDGTSEIDTSLMTGESDPALVQIGDFVRAGEVNLTGALLIEATATAQDTALARISDLVAQAENGRNKYTSLADKAASLYAPGVHILSVIAGIAWYLYTYDARLALNVTAAVLIITCPCALGLAVPAVVTAASGKLYRLGLLVKSATALERLAQIDTVVLDKTGTLTVGSLIPEGLEQFDMFEKQVLLGLASGSAHPRSVAICEALVRSGVKSVSIEAIQECPGFGVEGLLSGQPVRLGRAAWFGLSDQGATVFQIAEQAPKSLEFSEELKKGAQEMVKGFQERGLTVVCISGDRAEVVSALADKLELNAYHADMTPEAKIEFMEELKNSGFRALMIGDGMNDTGALVAAHVSMSPATALEAARVASDMVLLSEDLQVALSAFMLSKATVKRIRENFTIATFYNLIAVPFAMAALATPFIAALSMSASSLTVSLNALRLPRSS